MARVDRTVRGHAVRMPTYMCIAYGDQCRKDLPSEAPRAASSEAQLPIAGMSCIEAPDMDEAVRMVSEAPCAARHGVIEIWPLESPASA